MPKLAQEERENTEQMRIYFKRYKYECHTHYIPPLLIYNPWVKNKIVRETEKTFRTKEKWMDYISKFMWNSWSTAYWEMHSFKAIRKQELETNALSTQHKNLEKDEESKEGRAQREEKVCSN